MTCPPPALLLPIPPYYTTCAIASHITDPIRRLLSSTVDIDIVSRCNDPSLPIKTPHMATLPSTDNEHSALGTKVANLQHRWSQALRRSIKGDKDKDKGRDRDSDGNRQNAAPPNIQKLAVAIMPPKKVGKRS